MREAVGSLLRSVGLEVRAFASSQEFVENPRPDAPGCLILDVRLHGVSGLDLQKELSQSSAPLPIIFISGHGDIPMTVSAMKAGAVEFLTKPFRDQDLLDAVRIAVELDRARRKQARGVGEIRKRFAVLSPREREILRLIADGRLNKQVAVALGISEITVKVHRGHLMSKMKARTFADLMRMVGVLEAAALV
ncbi:MAG: DNA-binding response regulator [Caulobacter sp.]|nr:DNA-binding response regulator [Caulobacter sp.]